MQNFFFLLLNPSVKSFCFILLYGKFQNDLLYKSYIKLTFLWTIVIKHGKTKEIFIYNVQKLII